MILDNHDTNLLTHTPRIKGDGRLTFRPLCDTQAYTRGQISNPVLPSKQCCTRLIERSVEDETTETT